MLEKVLLVIIEYKRIKSLWTAQDLIREMIELVKACQGEVVTHIICRLDEPNASYLIKEGKVKEIEELCAGQDIQTVIFNHDLKGGQQRNLEEAIKRKVIDRTQLILDIFARRARSLEGKMQVELAQLEYLLPRLVGHGQEMSRLGGGIGTLGPGETKLEMDRRRIRKRIEGLRNNLKESALTRGLQRKKRQDDGIALVSLIGYTNAGKSTLMNALTQAGQVTHDGLFTTLDPLSRQLVLPNHQKVVLSDTVGFIHELPHHLVEAFKTTLLETAQSDLLLHVLDVSHPQFRNLNEAVLNLLTQLKVLDTGIITVLNKIDQLEDKSGIEKLLQTFKNSVAVSALHGQNLNLLLEKIAQQLSNSLIKIDVRLPAGRMDLVHLAHREGEVHQVKYSQRFIHLTATLNKKIAGQFNQFIAKK